MIKILVLGSTGMLGNYVNQYLKLNKKFNVTSLKREQFDAIYDDLDILSVERYDVVINCIGVINTLVHDVGIENTIIVNSIFPHKLSKVCNENNTKLIHITTDCVFSGKRDKSSPYNEFDLHDAVDIYGKTKSLGEPDDCCVIRTSIIGEEIYHKVSLLEWVKNSNNSEINGYTNWHWNGVTCLELAKIIEYIIEKKIYWNGVQHIFSPSPVSKYELIKYIIDAYNLNIKLIPSSNQEYNMRSLGTIYENIKNISSIKTQLEELSKFKLKEI